MSELAPAVLLHGLAGHSGEWAETASWLSERCRVVALDARGHGNSERRPADVSQEAHVADVVGAIEQLKLGPVIIVGQSLGGLTAMLVAAERPDLVRALVIVEASPEAGDPGSADAVKTSLERWPVPFPSREAARDYFGGPGLKGAAWADGLEQRDGGWWPRFDIDVMVRTLREADSRTYWEQWASIACPILVVRAGRGGITKEHAYEMARRGRDVLVAGVPDAAHDLHLEQPAQWRRVLEAFLDRLDAGPGS